MEPIFAEIARSLKDNHVTRVDVSFSNHELLPPFSIHGFILSNSASHMLLEKLENSAGRVPKIFSKFLDFTEAPSEVAVKTLQRKDLCMDERLR